LSSCETPQFHFFLNSFCGNIEQIPHFYRKAEKKLNRLNRRKSKKFKKGKSVSKNYLKAKNRYAKDNLKVISNGKRNAKIGRGVLSNVI